MVWQIRPLSSYLIDSITSHPPLGRVALYPKLPEPQLNQEVSASSSLTINCLPKYLSLCRKARVDVEYLKYETPRSEVWPDLKRLPPATTVGRYPILGAIRALA
jgi:hypothetical protein